MTFDLESWAVGILEGEGSFDSRVGAAYPRIQVGMNDVDVMERLRDYVREVIRNEPPELSPNQLPSGNTNYRLTLVGDDAIVLMQRILPMMGKRRTEKITHTLREYGTGSR